MYVCECVCCTLMYVFFFSSRRRHTRCALVTGVQTCALPISEALELARHDYAHVLAEAVQALWPGTQITFGPATDDGFYYDVMAPDSREPFGMDDLPAIEEEMRRIIRADKPLRREAWSRQQLIEKWSAEGERFKAEWERERAENEELTVYGSG